MAIFQSSVLKKYLKQLDTETVAKLYKKYTKYFHDPVIQQNIRESKEEQYQAKFLDELFVNVLGYTMNPQPNFNLTTEFKNVKNSRKADGAILDKDEAVAVIELKGTKTKDLESIRQQAFDYKANQPGCVYVITSNFEKLRFYINNAVDFEEFDLFMLSYERFEMLYLCLHKNNLLQHLPLKIKEASLHEEEAITKKFYSDYSNFKRELFRDMVKRNLRNPALKELGESSSKKELFKKTQKLLDRFLFIFFGEDRGLLPPNSIPKILEQWESLKKMDAYSALYERYKKYFGYLNEGWKGQDHEIFAYNGGLFKPDPILDTIEIDDELLFKHTSILTKYDFESQVDVNISGHIFEHSLNEIESVNAEIDGVEFDKQKTKRKKDGVFYTPKYITKYIVDNTVGKLCEEKKAELDIHEEEYLKGPKNRAKTTIQKLDEQLEAYRAWLLTLTICDPACGSGAFLNQALDFLILEHRWIDEMSSKLHGGGFVFPDIENSILEKNIYGVDLNDESVEIAKLSLWLRTAQKGRKLTSLNSNIKCGNSLIDSKAVAGDKAFNWEKEFPEVFAKGGFDVIIGNPPYVRNEYLSEKEKEFFKQNYTVFTGKSDLYVYFFEHVYNVLKLYGSCGFIVSSKYTKTKYGKILIDFLHKNTKIKSFIDYQDLDVFKGIVAYPSTIIFEKSNETNKNSKLLVVSNENYRETENLFNGAIEVDQNELFDRLGSWTSGATNDGLFEILKKIKDSNKLLSDIIAKPQVGIKTGSNACYLFTSDNIPKELNNSDLISDYLVGREVKRYKPVSPSNKILIPYIRNNNGNLDLIQNIDLYEHEHKYLTNNKVKLSSRAIIDKGILNGTKEWYEFQQIKTDFPYQSTFIVYPDISSTVNFTFAKGLYFDMTCFGLPSDSKSLLGILNSKLIRTFLDVTCVKARGGYLRLKSQYILNIPIPEKYEDSTLSSKVELMLSKSSELNTKQDTLLKLIISNFAISISNKLQTWYELTFSDFIKELNKAIKKVGTEKLSKLDEMEWMEVFETKKKEAMELKAEIDKTDREIDQLVYELYGLSEEEIGIVENS